MNMSSNFSNLFDRLVSELKNTNGSDNNLYAVLDGIIDFINKEMRTNFKIKHISADDLLKVGQTTFMFATDDIVNYSARMIRKYQNDIKTKKRSEYSLDYNDVTYAMFLIDTIAHELSHCNQYVDGLNGIISEQSYFNALCFALNTFKKVEYLDNSYEGEAYGNGIALTRKLTSASYLNNPVYVDIYNRQMSGFNFFRINSLFHETIYYLNKIPFMSTKRGFNDIVIYANYNLSLLDSKKVASILKMYPLISIGLENENGKVRMKTPFELMAQYFGGYIKYGTNKSFINDSERLSLIDIYVYLLMGQLTSDIYNDLCIKHGKDKMDSFMLSLKNNINKKLILYEACYKEALKRIKIIRPRNKDILQNVDEKYAKAKYDTAIIYLKEYLKRIDEFLGVKQNKRKY